MTTSLQILYICTTAILLLVKVECNSSINDEVEQKSDSSFGLDILEEALQDADSMSGDERGILGDLFAAENNLVMPPTIVTPTPTSLLNALASRNRTALVNYLNSNPLGGVFGTSVGINGDWVRSALKSCAKVNPNSITVILPTSTNGLTRPEMYYFENSTSNTKSWIDAEDWCTERGMHLVTVNDDYENKVLREKLIAIIGNNYDAAANNFWIGLNNLVPTANTDTTYSYIGDSSVKYLDWHLTPGTNPCVNYAQRANIVENIHFFTTTCATLQRFICEVSEECTALFMARYRDLHVPIPYGI